MSNELKELTSSVLSGKRYFGTDNSASANKSGTSYPNRENGCVMDDVVFKFKEKPSMTFRKCSRVGKIITLKHA